MRKIIIIIATIFLVTIVYQIFTYPNFDSIEESLAAKRTKNLNQENWKETYAADVKFDEQTPKKFSEHNIEKAEFYSGMFNIRKDLNRENSKKLVEILNDSNSYVWGEMGTPEYDRFLIFLDENDSVVGLTKIDVDDIQTHSEPMTRTMKWGFLSKKAKERFYKILNE